LIHHYGRIEVVCGSMFCGKTEELIRRVRRATIAKQIVQVFKPEIDDRYGIEYVISHDGQRINAMPLAHSTHILSNLNPDTNVVAIDEAQFFDSEIVNVVNELANEKDIRVIIAGLDLDFRGEPFGPMPNLMCMAEEVVKLHAICVECGDLASRTQRLVNGNPARYDDPVILVGATEHYEPRCRRHHIVVK
jgi:thymidine kinase